MALGQAKQYSSGGQQGGQPPPPPRPRVYPYRDAISTSTQHYDLFEMIRNPHPSAVTRPPDPPAPGALYEASLSKQFKIRRELEQRFYSSSDVLAGTAKVIRFFFLLLGLPVYMLIYRLPAWLLTQYLPSIIKTVTSAVYANMKKIGSLVERAAQACKSPFIKIWEAMVREVEMADQPAKEAEQLDFFAFIAHGFVLLYLQIYTPLKNGAIHSAKFLVKSAKALYEFPGKVRGFVNEKFDSLRQWKQALKAKIQARIRRFFHDLYDATIGRCKRMIARITDLKENLKNRLKSSLPTFEFPRLRRAIAYVKQRLSSLRMPKIGFPRIAMPKIPFNFATRYRDFYVQMGGLLNRLKNVKFRSPFSLPSLPKITLPKIEWRPYSEKVFAPVKRYGIEAIRYPLWMIAKPIVAATGPMISAWRKRSKKENPFKVSLKMPKLDFLRPYIQPVKEAQAVIVLKIETISMHVRFFIAWTHILLRYGMAQVKEFADNLI